MRVGDAIQAAKLNTKSLDYLRLTWVPSSRSNPPNTGNLITRTQFPDDPVNGMVEVALPLQLGGAFEQVWILWEMELGNLPPFSGV